MTSFGIEDYEVLWDAMKKEKFLVVSLFSGITIGEITMGRVHNTNGGLHYHHCI